ncbi:MAG: hypothetical protein NZT61_02195 [Deltaproteobacteria bacterium]|nr:hypothetical protein [Deltaproteobacteria bacterium]MCX7953118.1 hypothetical protein [Deltaproteobacteria bacterium]
MIRFGLMLWALTCFADVSLTPAQAFCSRLIGDKALDVWIEFVENATFSYSDCPQCFTLKNFFKNSCKKQNSKKDEDDDMIKYPPHPEILVILEKFKQGKKFERDLYQALSFICQSVKLENSAKERYISFICSALDG